MSTTTLSQRLRELREYCLNYDKAELKDTPFITILERREDLLKECIAQAEAQEGQSWELSDEDKSALVEEFALEAVDTANKPRREEQERIYNGAAQQGELMMEFLGRKGISFSNIGALSPSKDGGEQTPVTWIYEDTLPDGYLSSGLSDRQVETIIDEVLMAEGNMDQLRSRLTALK